MHEVALVKNLLSILEKETASPQIGRVKTIYLEVGQLHRLSPEIIAHSFAHLAKPKKLDQAKIKVKMVLGNEVKIKSIEW